MFKALRRKALRKYFDYENRIKMTINQNLLEQGVIGGKWECRVLNLRIIPTFRTTHIFICVQYPGFLIGRQGKNIKALREELSNRYGKVKIHLSERDPFWSR